jgi:formylmethanofuran dehydrogenase subunit E
MEEIEYWQIDKIESMLQLCPYDEQTKMDILNNLPETKEEAYELLGKLWFDHIPRDPRDQLSKMLRMNTLIQTDYKYYYICNDCGEDFYSSNKETLCTECLSTNIIDKSDET